MKYNKWTRRHFLQGMGGFTLSLPFLPSLMSRQALAQAVSNSKCFFAMSTEHGGALNSDIYGKLLSYHQDPHPKLSSFKLLSGGTDPLSGKVFPDHSFHYGNLIDFLQTAAQAGDPEDPDNGLPRLSYILGSKFNSLLPNMNVLRGI